MINLATNDVTVLRLAIMPFLVLQHRYTPRVPVKPADGVKSNVTVNYLPKLLC